MAGALPPAPPTSPTLQGLPQPPGRAVSCAEGGGGYGTGGVYARRREGHGKELVGAARGGPGPYAVEGHVWAQVHEDHQGGRGGHPGRP